MCGRDRQGEKPVTGRPGAGRDRPEPRLEPRRLGGARAALAPVEVRKRLQVGKDPRQRASSSLSGQVQALQRAEAPEFAPDRSREPVAERSSASSSVRLRGPRADRSSARCPPGPSRVQIHKVPTAGGTVPDSPLPGSSTAVTRLSSTITPNQEDTGASVSQFALLVQPGPPVAS